MSSKQQAVDESRDIPPDSGEVDSHDSPSSRVDGPEDDCRAYDRSSVHEDVAKCSSNSVTSAENQVVIHNGPLDNAPPEILERIFLFVDDTTLIKNVPAVCRKWRYVCRDLMKPMFSLGPEQWGITSAWDHAKVKQEWLNCLVVRFTHAFKRSSALWLGLICEKDAFEAAKLLLQGTEDDVDSILHTIESKYGDQVTETLLGIALRNNKSKIVDLLLKCGARVENIKQEFALHAAAQNGHLDVVRYLVEVAKEDAGKTDNDGRTPVHAAAAGGRLDVVRYLVEEAKQDAGKADNYGQTPIWIAARNGRLDVVRYLVEDAKQDAGKANNHGETPIHAAAWDGHLDVVRYLVEEVKQDAGKTDNNGRTPIHVAVLNGHLDVVRYLVEEAKVDFNKASIDGLTPLCIATDTVAVYLRSIGAK